MRACEWLRGSPSCQVSGAARILVHAVRRRSCLARCQALHELSFYLFFIFYFCKIIVSPGLALLLAIICRCIITRAPTVDRRAARVPRRQRHQADAVGRRYSGHVVRARDGHRARRPRLRLLRLLPRRPRRPLPALAAGGERVGAAHVQPHRRNEADPVGEGGA